MLNPTFVKELTSLVGPQYIMSELEDRICYSFDATFIDSLQMLLCVLVAGMKSLKLLS